MFTRSTRSIGSTRVLLPAFALALGLALAACGDDAGVAGSPAPGTTPDGGVVVQDAWIRATEGTADPTMSAAFMVIDNDGAEDVELVGAATPAARRTELHEMAVVDGDPVMRQVAGGITITAGRGKVLEPGGYHVMLLDLTGPLAAGDEVELTLEFSDGTAETLTAPVKEFTEEEGHYHAPGTGAHSHGDQQGHGAGPGGGHDDGHDH